MKTAVWFLVAALGVLFPGKSTSAHPAAAAPVYVIPVRGQIEGALLYVMRRGLAEAEQKKAAAVILVMNSPGGTLDAASDIVHTIQSSSLPIYTFVEKKALSAGAIIALATRAIYMAPGSVIGDALPVLMTPFGGIQEMPESYEEKAVSAVAALVRSAAQTAGHDPEVAEKMVRRDQELKIGDEVISPAGRLLTLTAEEAARPVRNGKPLLSAGTVKNLEEVLQQLAISSHPTIEIRITAAEQIARWIAAAGPILMMIGLLGIYIEIRTPGFGLPGMIGAICLILFFWGHHIAGLAGLEDLALFVVGILLILVEIFLLPGFGLAGLAGITLVLISLLGAMIRLPPGGPWWPSWNALQIPLFKLGLTVTLTATGILILGRFLPRSRLFRRLALETATAASAGYTAAPDRPNLVGRRGVAVTPLRPAGAARFDADRFDVITSGEFLDAGTPVRIIEARGNHIVVEKEQSPAAG